MKREISFRIIVIASLAMISASAVAADDIRIDHILWGAPDLAKGVEQFETLSGIKPVFGGVHPGRGTANYLVNLGEDTYLEIIGPNPDAADENSPTVEAIRAMAGPAIYTFAVSTTDIQASATAATGLGLVPEGPIPGERQKTDGETLRWQRLMLGGHDFGTAIPFAIDWGESTHPAGTSAEGAALVSLEINHPRAGALRQIYDALGIPVRVEQAGTAEFIARINTPRGEIELRGEILD